MKKIALLFLFVLAVTAGYSQKGTIEQKAKERTDKLSKELTLTKDQYNKAYTIHVETMKERKALEEKYGNNKDQQAKKDATKVLKVNYDKKMKAILTDAQYTKFKASMKKSK